MNIREDIMKVFENAF